MRLASLLLAMLSVFFQPVNAQSASTTSIKCTVTGGSLAFGGYNPLSSDSHLGTGSVYVNCRGGPPTTARLEVSAGNSGNFSQRYMTDGSNLLYYNIYSDASHTQIIGDGSGSSVNSGLSFEIRGNTSKFLFIYGSAPGGQNVPVGSYSDNLRVTVVF